MLNWLRRKKSVVASGRAITAGYKSTPHIWFNQPRDLPPFTHHTVRAMMIDPGIRLNLATRCAPIMGAEFGFKNSEGGWTEGLRCNDPVVGEFIYRQVRKIWHRYLPCILRSQIWGWSAGEVVLQLNEHGLIEVDRLESRFAGDCKLLKLNHERWGVQIDRVEGQGAVQLKYPHCWFHAFRNEDGEDYGMPILLGAYSPWADKWFNGGALDVRRLFMHKDAYGGADLGFPEGSTFLDSNQQPVPNQDIANQIVEQMRTGAVVTRPSERDENGNEKWPLQRATVTSNPQHILEYPKDCDNEIRVGMEIADDVISSDGGGAWAGKRIPLSAFYSSLDEWVVQILCDVCEQIIDPLVLLNFGKRVEYELRHKPLAEQAMEQQSNAGPGQPGQDGGDGLVGEGMPGMEPEQDAQQQMPARLSLEAIGRGEYDSGVVANVMRMGTDVSQSDVDYIASELDSLEAFEREVEIDPDDESTWDIDPLGDAIERLRMSLDAQGHEHRGKGKGGGQFVSKGKGGDSATGQSGLRDEGENEQRRGSKKPSDKTRIDEEQTTAPPPGKAFLVDVESPGKSGVAKAARVGVPGTEVPPPPKIPKLPNLTGPERAVEQRFKSAFEADPNGMAHKYRELIGQTSKPHVFETDQAKVLSDDWVDDDLDTQMKKRHMNNNALHQTANAIVKRAFQQHLDTLKPGDKVLVTVGGCGAGKGYTLKNTPLGKGLAAETQAVWDSAGDQNATENPWIQEEAEKRGLTVTYAYVAGDAKFAWSNKERGVVTRAHNKEDGRMVDAAVFADSYVMGAKNHHAFHQANKDNPNANFLFFSNVDQSQLPGVPEEHLNQDRHALYNWAMGSIQSRDDVSPSVMRGATQGARIWNDEFS